MAQVHVQVSEEKKKQWDDAAKSSEEYRSLSDLVRLSVSRELSNDPNGPQGQAIDLGQLSEIIEGINRLDSRMGKLESRMQSVETELSEDPEIGKLATEVFSLLPTEEPGTIDWEGKLQEYKQSLGHEQFDSATYHGWKGSLEGLAEALEHPEYRIEEAIQKIQNDNPGLIQETDDNRYYKRE
jgi:uncharacterized protein (UPF0335 family)